MSDLIKALRARAKTHLFMSDGISPILEKLIAVVEAADVPRWDTSVEMIKALADLRAAVTSEKID